MLIQFALIKLKLVEIKPVKLRYKNSKENGILFLFIWTVICDLSPPTLDSRLITHLSPFKGPFHSATSENTQQSQSIRDQEQGNGHGFQMISIL